MRFAWSLSLLAAGTGTRRVLVTQPSVSDRAGPKEVLYGLFFFFLLAKSVGFKFKWKNRIHESDGRATGVVEYAPNNSDKVTRLLTAVQEH
jgi:hypothetical protein